jgi:hypothetical protein
VYAAEGVPCFTAQSGLLKAGGKGVFTSDTCEPKDLIGFINVLDIFFYRLAIVLAVLMITIGGLQWLMAIGNASKISNAKDTIQQAVLGLILALTAILLFNQIDTSFTNLKPPGLASNYAFVCDQIHDPSSCRSHPGVAACRWKCDNVAEENLPELPKDRVIPEDEKKKYRNPFCLPGKCEPVTELTEAKDLQICSSPYYVNGCKESAPLAKVKECMAILGPATLGEVTTTGKRHSEYSCHFGGRLCKDGGHSIDYGNEKSYNLITSTMSSCIRQYNTTMVCNCEDENGKRYRTGLGFPDCNNGAVTHIHCDIGADGCHPANDPC